jgi:hypothetical protein
MDDANLAKLHATLEEKSATRGKSGGLGFESKKHKVKKQAASDGPSKREFATTTSGAVAAGHWDPWARPVEFKMKEANRKVGGLYTMFVRGDTMGGSLAEAKPSHSEADAAAGAFSWKSEIRAHLRKAAGPLPGKQLRKAVVAAASRALGVKAKADLRLTYSEQLPRTKRVVVDAATGSVTLAPKGASKKKGKKKRKADSSSDED